MVGAGSRGSVLISILSGVFPPQQQAVMPGSPSWLVAEVFWLQQLSPVGCWRLTQQGRVWLAQHDLVSALQHDAVAARRFAQQHSPAARNFSSQRQPPGSPMPGLGHPIEPNTRAAVTSAQVQRRENVPGRKLGVLRWGMLVRQ